jgi:glutathionylspermidine amidase/synthetase
MVLMRVMIVSMDSENTEEVAKFGTVLGIAPGNVPAYSSDYDTADDKELPNRHAYQSYIDEVFLGYKWQCVEFARRWLYLNKGYVFDDVAMAYEIFHLRFVRMINGDDLLSLHSFRNGSKRWPEHGCMLIWSEGGQFKMTGHVAIVTEVTSTYLRIVEQNVGDQTWPNGRNYAREIKATVDEEGGYWLECNFGDSTILGWVIQTDDPVGAEQFVEDDSRLFILQMRELAKKSKEQQHTWLNVANQDEKAYVSALKGHKLSENPEDEYRYMCISSTTHRELKRATNELHALFLRATDYVLEHEHLLEKFNFPKIIWPKLHQSWDNRRNQMITGRFDFCLTEQGIKLYEYNADSASCYMEAGKIQGKWAEHYGCDEGWNPSGRLYEELVEAWKESDIDGLLHVMLDKDSEDTYHGLFMVEAIKRAGIPCKIIHGLENMVWGPDGHVVDADGDRIRAVWKVWAWETALEQIRVECEYDQQRLTDYCFRSSREQRKEQNRPPRLSDVLLQPEVLVYEPLWTLIPSNKAILPILWELFPESPYLLESHFTLTDSLKKNGYVVKPIVGRGGANIQIFSCNNALVDKTTGQFGSQKVVYQTFCKLPKAGPYHAQLSGFSVSGAYAGTCIRVTPGLVVSLSDNLLALRVVSDAEFLRTK